MRVQNNSGATLEIGGVKIKAKEAEAVPAWEAIKGLPVIKAWLRTGVLSVLDDAPQALEQPTEEATPEPAAETEEPAAEDQKPKAFLGLKW